jgi:hypothetical protein
MEISFRINTDDLIATNDFLMSRSPTFKKALKKHKLTSGIILSLALIINIYSLVKRFSLPFGFSAPDLILAFLLAFFVYLVYRYFTVAQSMRKRMAKEIVNRYSQGENGVTGDHKFVITAENVTDITKIDSSSSVWAGIEEVTTNEKYLFILKRASNSGWSIPKSAFTSDSEFSQFAETAKQYHQAALAKAKTA